MASEKQRQAARRNVKKAQSGARSKRTISNLDSKTRSALGREGAKAAARKRADSQVPGATPPEEQGDSDDSESPDSSTPPF